MISKAIGKVIDSLPLWGQLIVYCFTVIGIVYYIAKYGFFGFLLRLIFSP